MIETDVLVIGAGQCGLALSRELTVRGVSHEVVDRRSAPGDVWRERWDSLRLFTPARFDALPGRPFPSDARHLPTAHEFADYLDGYSEEFAVPLHPGLTAIGLTPSEGGFEVTTQGDAPQGDSAPGEVRRWRACRVVVATGGQTRPHVPDLGGRLDPRIPQLHTSQYRRPDDLPGDRVLVVGCGTSGVQLGVELSEAGRHVTVAGRPTPHIPAALLAVAGVAWFAFLHRMLTRGTPIGRRAAERVIGAGAPLLGIGTADLDRAGAARAPRLAGVEDGLPRLADGSIIETDAVLWATGYRPALDWIEGLPLDEYRIPAHERGLSMHVPGLAFLGLPFQFGLTSTLIGGAGRDAAYLADTLAGASRLLPA